MTSTTRIAIHFKNPMILQNRVYPPDMVSGIFHARALSYDRLTFALAADSKVDYRNVKYRIRE
jgi:hypothetical protein